MSAALRIFSYLPNPRVWKALIAADYCGLSIDVVGDKTNALAEWLWDFDARKLTQDEMTDDSPHARRGRRGFNATLYKTDGFLRAHPFGTVPAAFSPDGQVGIFESNSILRAVARLGESTRRLYGGNPYEAARIDGFLDAALVFTREAQAYVFAQPEVSLAVYERMQAAYVFYLGGVEQALGETSYVAGAELSIADIAFACDLGQFSREKRSSAILEPLSQRPISAGLEQDYPRATQHLKNLCSEPQFASYADALLKHID